MSPPNVSLLFPHRDQLEFRSQQDFATGLSTGGNRSATNFLDDVTCGKQLINIWLAFRVLGLEMNFDNFIGVTCILC